VLLPILATARFGRGCPSAPLFQVIRDIPGCANNLECCYVVAHSGVNDQLSKLWCNLESTAPSPLLPIGALREYAEAQGPVFCSCSSSFPHERRALVPNSRGSSVQAPANNVLLIFFLLCPVLCIIAVG
jgi:hypothetical protein